MKWLIITVFVILTQQPSKAPETKGVTEGKSAQVSKQSDSGNNQNQPSKQTPSLPADNHHPATEIQCTASKTSDDTEVPRKIETFTGLLVVVGVLQFFALIGQVVIYCRQAKIMGRQAHEMRRQRGYMRLQWKAMGVQAAHMEGQLSEMAKTAALAEKTLVLQFRPHLKIRGIGLIVGSHIPIAGSLEELSESDWKIELMVANPGGTTTHVVASNVTVFVQQGFWSPFPPYSPERASLGQISIAPGEHRTLSIVLSQRDAARFTFLKLQAERGATAGNVYCVGFIDYRDDVGVIRRTAFFRNCHIQSESFVKVSIEATREYEYED